MSIATRPRPTSLSRAMQSLLDAISDVNWKMSACGDATLWTELSELRSSIARSVNRLEMIQGTYPHLAGEDGDATRDGA